MGTNSDREHETPGRETVEFRDCTRIRVAGRFEDVVCGVTFVSDDEQPGTIVDSVGGVDGERTVDAAVEFDLSPESTVLEYVELFETEPGIPGLGDERVENPKFEDCYVDRVAGHVDDSELPEYVEFVDCETVRITESVTEVLLSLFWWDDRGQLGTIAEPVGSVDGERTISAAEEFGTFAYGPVVSGIELFDDGTPVVPGGGAVSIQNPDAESCTASIREASEGLEELDVSQFERS